MAVLLNYNLTKASDILKNNVIIVSRFGISNGYDVVLAVPQMYSVNRTLHKNQAPYGSVGNIALTLHKQHLAQKFDEHLFMLATNYLLEIPVGTNAKFGAGWGFGFSWIYHNMSAIFDLEARIYSDLKSPSFASKGGYYYAFNEFIYAGIEYNWDFNSKGRVFLIKQPRHNLAIGPTLSFKIPQLKNSAIGIGFYGDPVDKISPWKLGSRLAIFF